MNVERITVDELRARGLVPAIRAMLAPSYESPDALIERALEHNTDAYLGTLDQRLVAFFLVAWETLTIAGTERPAVYLGLSGEGADHGATDASDLYRAFRNDARVWEGKRGQRLILWGTTATPSVFWAMERLFADGQPFGTGQLSAWAEPVVAAIRQQYYPALETRASDPVFVLRHAARATRYSASERDRITRIENQTGFRLFRDVDLDEPSGDRVVFLCRTRS